ILVAVALAAVACPPKRKIPPCDPSTKAQVFFGLYSIYQRSDQVGDHAALPGWAPGPLKEAARALVCDPDNDRRPGRKRYAAMKLASALVILQRDHADAATIGEFDAALEVLGAHPLAGKLLAVSATSFKELQDQAGLLL